MRAWQWWCGEVEFRCEGGLCERFLSLLTEQEGVALRRVAQEEGAVRAVCRASDYRKVRRPARRTGTRVKAVARRGADRWRRRLFGRPGLWLGAVTAFVLYTVLTSYIWVLDIPTDRPDVREAVERELAACGVAIGAPSKGADLAAARMRAVAGVDSLHQMSVYLDGCTAHVDIRWEDEGVTRPDTTPANVTAACDGQILSMRVTEGKAMVKAGDAVVAGDLLVCGAVETAHGVLLRRAAAEITARTVRRFTATVERTEQHMFDGRVIRQPSVRLLWWSIPCYSPSVPTDGARTEAVRSPLTWFGTPLPLGVEDTVYTERGVWELTFEEEQMTAVARARVSAQAAAALGNATVEAVDFEERWDGERFVLSGCYTCIENIAVQTPLLADFE